MQQLPGLPEAAFAKADPSPDAEFYAWPRFVTHIDNGAIAAVTETYRALLPPGGTILDLMSSWVSHLPDDVAYAAVTGHGMNAEELAANPRLSRWFVQDLNAEPRVCRWRTPPTTPPACACRCSTCNARWTSSATSPVCCGQRRPSSSPSPTAASRPRRSRSGSICRVRPSRNWSPPTCGPPVSPTRITAPTPHRHGDPLWVVTGVTP